MLVLDNSDVQEEITYWSTALYCHILGSDPPWTVVNEFIRRVWGKHGVDKVATLPKGLFMVRFSSEQGKIAALKGGHQLFDGRLLIAKEWSPDVVIGKEDVIVIPTWIRLYDLELKFWGEACLRKIAGLVGNPINCDEYTLTKSQLEYARILVEVTVGQEFPDKLQFVDENGVIQQIMVAYEWKPVVCSLCKSMGHGADSCRKRGPRKPKVPSTAHVEHQLPIEKVAMEPQDPMTTEKETLVEGNALQMPPEVVPQAVPSSGSLLPARLVTRTTRLKKEQEEKEEKRKYKAQAHLYTIIKVARDDDLAEQIGRDIYFDLVDHEKVRSFRVQKQTTFNQFKEEVAKEFGIPVEFQRYWIWAKRQNHTYRPNRPLRPAEELQPVGQLREASKGANIVPELKLFLDVEIGLDLRPLPLPDKTKDEILLFFKLYDPEKEELRYVGRLFVKSAGKPVEILTKLNEMAGFSPEEEIDVFEEIKFEPCVMCELLDKIVTFRQCQLEDGDIICFQKTLPIDYEERYRYPDVPSFLEYVHNRQV